MQRHTKLEAMRIVLEDRAFGEEMLHSDRDEEEERCSEEHVAFLQCGDSLAANRVGESAFRVTRVLRGLRELRAGW